MQVYIINCVCYKYLNNICYTTESPYCQFNDVFFFCVEVVRWLRGTTPKKKKGVLQI